MPVFIKGRPVLDDDLDEKEVLWRYVDTAKFLDFLLNQRLFFPRGDTFPDKFEGAFTAPLKQKISDSFATEGIDSTYEEFKLRLRQRVFLNCWHASVDDSMAMWSIYGRSANSVAITTTVGRLRDCLAAANIRHLVAIKRVRYIKHWRNPKIEIRPYSNVFAYKVKAYDFEKEVRVIIDRFSAEYDSPMLETGMYIPIASKKLIRSIVVAPEAPTWYLDIVQGVVDKYGSPAPVKKSKLAFPPV
jgi:hypothetical protein